MVRRIPCRVCNQQSSSPNNFLLICACGVVCHHRCLEPPMAHSTLLGMIDAFNRGVHEKSIRSWRCGACMGTESKLVKPVSARLPTRGNNVARYLPTDKIHARQTAKNVADNQREHGWHEHVPAPRGPLHLKPQMGTSTEVWPPVRHKIKSQLSTMMKESHGASTDSKVKVAQSGVVGSLHLKPSLRSNLNTTLPPHKKIQRDHWHPGDLFITASTRTEDDIVKNVFNYPLFVTQAGAISSSATQSFFPVPCSAPKDLLNLSPLPTTSRKPIRLNDPMTHPIHCQEANITPSTPIPPISRPPLIDLHKVVKRKRTAVLRKASTTESAGEGPSHKRRRLELINNRKGDLQTTNGQPDIVTPNPKDIVDAPEDRHVIPVDIALPPNAARDEHPHECLPSNGEILNVQICQAAERSQQQLSIPGAETHTVDHHTGDAIKPITQPVSPATSHRSVDAASCDDSLALSNKLIISPTAAPSPSRKLYAIRNQIPPKLQPQPPPPLTPRSLSPPRQTVAKNVLDNVVARVQQQARQHDQRRPSETLESDVRIPRLARWFKDMGPKLITATRGNRKRWKKPSAKALMVGIGDEWTLIGAQIWATR